ncbi:hypothetical protein GCM10027265_05280 [Jatrophihabitans fulvus]
MHVDAQVAGERLPDQRRGRVRGPELLLRQRRSVVWLVLLVADEGYAAVETASSQLFADPQSGEAGAEDDDVTRFPAVGR